MSNNRLFHVITTYENPFELASRRDNYIRFKERLGPEILLWTATVLPLNRKHVWCEDPFSVALRAESLMNHKENAINQVVRNVIQKSVKYIAWVDADICFMNPRWYWDAMNELDKGAKVVQLFSHAQNLGPQFQPIGDPRPSYFYQYCKLGKIIGGVRFWDSATEKIPDKDNAHPGLGFAMELETFYQLGGLFDYAITGSGDFHMDAAFLGELMSAIKGQNYSVGYQSKCLYFQSACDQYIQGKVGFVPGLVLHYWHGARANRKYASYRQPLTVNMFDPAKHLWTNKFGLYEFEHKKAKNLENSVHDYIVSRNDDDPGEALAI